MKDEEIEKGDCGAAKPEKAFRFLLDLNQAVPNHLAEEKQIRNLLLASGKTWK